MPSATLNRGGEGWWGWGGGMKSCLKLPRSQIPRFSYRKLMDVLSCRAGGGARGPWPSSRSREGGAKGAMPPPWLVKIGQKKMAAMHRSLYFMFLAPPPLRSFWIRYCAPPVPVKTSHKKDGRPMRISCFSYPPPPQQPLNRCCCYCIWRFFQLKQIFYGHLVPLALLLMRHLLTSKRSMSFRRAKIVDV